MNIELHGTQGKRNITLPASAPTLHAPVSRDPDKEASVYHRRKAFKIANELRPKLEQLQRTEDDLWNSIKAQYGVESRSQLRAAQWAVVAAQLKCANENRGFLGRILSRQDPTIEKGKASNYRVYRVSDTGHTKRIYEASADSDRADLEARGQAYADASGKQVRIIQQSSDYIRTFIPKDIDIPY